MLFLQEGQVMSAEGPGEPFRRGVEWEGWGILRVNSLQGVPSSEAGALPVGYGGHWGHPWGAMSPLRVSGG